MNHVIDYAAQGIKTKPRMLHRPDCPHPDRNTPFRKATPEELSELPTLCGLRKEGSARMSHATQAVLVTATLALAVAGCGGSNNGCAGHPCIGDWQREQAEGGAVVQCADGAWSHAGGLSGACSHHGGEQ